MSGNGPDKAPPGQDQPYFPPPPPGPPPAQGATPYQPFSNIPPPPHDPNKPAYGQSATNVPHFDPPPESELYDVPPSEQHHYQQQQQQQQHQQQQGQEHHHHGGGGSRSDWAQRLSGWGTKASAPFNALANKMGAEGFLPATMDKECEKAARILRAFCKEGIYSDTTTQEQGVPPSSSASASTKESKSKSRVLLTIPPKVIARAQGLVIFTMARAGFHVTGATGSGVLVARRPDGSWSPPSGVQIHTLGAGFAIGLDIYDCVVVVNTREALEAFTRTRVSLGPELAVAAGPYGAGGMVQWGLGQDDDDDEAKKKKERDRRGRGNIGDEKPAAPAGATTQAQPADLPSHPNLVPPPTTFDQTQPQVTTGTGTAPTSTVSTPPPPQPPRRKPSPSPLRDALRKPVYSYVKSRGFYAGVQIDGTVVTERRDANAAFYGAPVDVARILAGDVRPQPGPNQWPAAARGLMEVLRGAEGGGTSASAGGAPPQDHPQNAAAPGPVPSTSAYSYSPAAASSSSSAAGVSAVTTGVGGLSLAGPSSGGAAAASAASGGTPRYASKAEEAEAERRANEAAEPPPPPAYDDGFPPPPPPPPPASYGHEGGGGDDLPPAYVDDGRVRPGVGDAKSGQH